MTRLQTRCACGEVRGTLTLPPSALRLTCCCDDCQSFAHHLGREGFPDQYGGSEVVQVPPSALSFDHGFDRVHGVRLTSKGQYRWYAGCCRTPIANTMSPNISFIGVLSPFIADHEALTAAIGPSEAYTQLKWATAPVPAELNPRRLPLGLIVRSVSNIARWKLGAHAGPSPFFSPEDGAPIPPVDILAPGG